jgi:hypothetical protein
MSTEENTNDEPKPRRTIVETVEDETNEIREDLEGIRLRLVGVAGLVVVGLVLSAITMVTTLTLAMGG